MQPTKAEESDSIGAMAKQGLKLGLPQKMPLYKQVANVLAQRIKRGDFDTDPNLPSVRQLAADLDVSHGVAQRAMQYLQGQRLIESRPTVGTKLTSSQRLRFDATAFLFGFVQPSVDLWASALFQQVERATEQRQNLCVMRTSHHDAERERHIIDHLINNGVNGLLLLPVEADRNRDYLQSVMQQIPIVFVDRTIEGVIAPSVVLDYRRLAHDVVAWFAQRNCRRVLLAHDPMDISTYQEFAHAFEQALEHHGLSDAAERFDWPLVDTIYRYQRQADDKLITGFFQGMAHRLRTGGCDAVFCPQSELMRLLFHVDGRLEDRCQALTLATAIGASATARQARELIEAGVTCWVAQNASMLLQGIDMLQETVMSRLPTRKQVRLAFNRLQDLSEMYS